jgi:hypothetical protein
VLGFLLCAVLFHASTSVPSTTVKPHDRGTGRMRAE